MASTGSPRHPSKARRAVPEILEAAISLLILDTPSQAQLEEALGLSLEVIARARETQEWLRVENAGRVNAATALLDLGHPLRARNEVLLALRKARTFSLSAEDRIKALALLGACEKALGNPEGAKAAYSEALRFADRALAGRALPKDQTLLRVQALALKQGRGRAYVAVTSSIQQHRDAVEDELNELRPAPTSPAVHHPSEFESRRLAGKDAPVSASVRRPLSPQRLALFQLIQGDTETLYMPVSSRDALEQILANNQRALEALGDVDSDDEIMLRIQAHQNSAVAWMHLGQVARARAALLEAERLAAPIELDLCLRYLNWVTLIRAFIVLGERTAADDRLAVALRVARGLVGKKLVRPRGKGLEIPQHQWDLLRRQAGGARQLIGFVKNQQKELRQLRVLMRVASGSTLTDGVAEAESAECSTIDEIRKRLPVGVWAEWPKRQDGILLAEWLHEHGYDTIDPTLVGRYYSHVSSLNDFVANVVIVHFLPTVRERDRRMMASCFESGKRPYSLIGRIESAVEGHERIALSRVQSRTIAELTAAVRAVPHATLPGEIRIVLKTAAARYSAG